MDENQTNAPISQITEPKPSGRDYLAPALIFIALFFSFFVLITMQRLSRKAVGGEDPLVVPVPQQHPVQTNKETTPSTEVDPKKQQEKDDQTDVDVVGDNIIEAIDKTTVANDAYGDTDLDELAE